MISNDTLFILGAGASYPYGYPTGKELRHKICTEFPNEYNALLGSKADVWDEDVVQIAENFAATFFNSSTPSIDLFLARNHNFSEIGRKAIALFIWIAEINSSFRENADQNQDWYSYLYQRMTETLTKPDSYKQINQNKLSFITFNYDRSLEHFLYESIINSFTSIPRTQPPRGDLLPFSFQHVYGQLSALPWQSPHYLKYAEKLNKSDFHHIWHNIRVIYDRTGDNLETIKDQIAKAKRIFFLGFGYAKENLEVLSIPELLTGEQNIYGTAFGMTEKEIENVRTILSKNFKIKDPRLNNPRIMKMNCYELLREYL